MDQCPWSPFEKATIEFCERELCFWISQPANTWSNIGFVIVGYYIVYKTFATQRLLSLIGFSSIVVGVGSGLFHASGTFMFELLDLFGMFLISGLMVCFNLWRLKPLNNLTMSIIFLCLVSVSQLIMILNKPMGIPVFATHLYLAISLEIILFMRNSATSYKYSNYMVGAFILSFTAWGVDIAKIICNPDNHWINGHAIWHLLNAAAIFFMYKFYEQFFSEDLKKISRG